MRKLPLTSNEDAARYRAAGRWGDRTIFERFADVAARVPDKAAVVEIDRTLTYGDLAARVDALAGNLLDLGLQPGDMVALQAMNCAEMPLLHLACNRVGLLYLPVHDSWRELEVEHLLGRSRARMVVTPLEYRGFDHAAMIAGLRASLPDLEHVFTLDGAGGRAFSELLAPSEHTGVDLDAHRPDPDLPGHVMLSGGTTALSKMARFSSNDLLNLLDNFARAAALTADDVVAGLAPAGTGATGYVYGLLVPLLHGATAVVLRHWSDPMEAVDLVVDHRCTYAVGIPTQLTRMVPALEQRSPDEFASFRLFTNAGAPLPYETGVAIERLMGCVSQSIYGATDGGVPTMTTVTDPPEKRLGTVGRVVDGFELELRAPDGSPAPPGEPGEIVWRGPDKSWGYLADDEQTALAFTSDHFYRSGDLGLLDAEGYLAIVGRVKDMILRGGRNISPRTIEEQLIKHPAVVDVAVAAMPDRELGERACAFVILRDGTALTFDDMVRFLEDQHLARWQLPERLVVLDDLPRGPGGKVVKSKLTELVVARMTAEAGEGQRP